MSLHIGLNEVDAGHYGSKFPLDGCENDANAMAEIAKYRGFGRITRLTGPAATSKAVNEAFQVAAAKLYDGDTFMITFSGHGTTIKNPYNPPEDPNDQTWALYDRLMTDNELYELWTCFRPGVRIAVVSDSCYSGSILTYLKLYLATKYVPQTILDLPPVNVRVISYEDGERVYEAHQGLYYSIQKSVVDAQSKPVHASILLLAACQDWQQAWDGNPNGLFTGALLKVWQSGAFPSDYINFWAAIYGEVNCQNPYQSPDYRVLGPPNMAFYESMVFSI
jgi:hypothetical protein